MNQARCRYWITIQENARNSTGSIPKRFRGQVIAHSENAPCPNRKKLVLPASTTATITVFLPALMAMNGCRRAGGAVLSGGGGRNQCRMRRDSERGWGGCDRAGTTGGGGGAAPLTGRRCRGMGGGISGEMSNKSVSSRSEGIGVVRAFTTTI